MSETVRETGKLVPLKISREEAIKLCMAHSDAKDWTEWYDCPFEALVCETNDYINVHGLGFCRIENYEQGDANYYVNVRPLSDGTFDFHAVYYNGGASLSEALNCELDKLFDENGDPK